MQEKGIPLNLEETIYCLTGGASHGSAHLLEMNKKLKTELMVVHTPPLLQACFFLLFDI